MEPRKVACIEHGAAADAVKIGDLDRRARVVDRIVGVALAAVGADVEIVELTRLPIASGAGILGRLHPVALLETENVHLGLGETPGDSSTGSPGADDQDVNRSGHAKRSRLKWHSNQSESERACQWRAVISSCRSYASFGRSGHLSAGKRLTLRAKRGVALSKSFLRV